MNATETRAQAEVPTLMVADPHDELQPLVDELARQIRPFQLLTDEQRALKTIGEGQPLVLLLSFNRLEQSQVFYLRVLKRIGAEGSDCLQTVFLCDRAEAARAFDLCREEIADDYLVARPLYDPHQLALAVKQARERLVVRGWLASLAAGQAARKDLRGLLADLEATVGGQVPPNPRLQRAIEELRAAVVDISDQVDQGARLVEQSRSRRDRALNAQPLVRGDLPAQVRPHEGTVLVVDDDDFYQQVVREVLESEGYQVLTAPDGNRALTLLSMQRVSLVLMDIELPKMSGIEATRRIRPGASMIDVPIIMLTAHGEQKRVIEALEAGATDFIVKPAPGAVLLQKVEGCLQEGR